MLNIHGIATEEIQSDGHIFWWPQINKPHFYPELGLAIGLSRAWIKEAQQAGVEKIYYEWNGGKFHWWLPENDKALKRMEKDELCQEKIINYPNTPLKRYLFTLR